jgi:hypothetical protein
MKLKHIFFATLVALLTACTNQESLLKDYEKACENGNNVKAARIMEKMEKKYPKEDDWTEEQQERIVNATAALTEKTLEKAGGVLNSIGNMENLFK